MSRNSFEYLQRTAFLGGVGTGCLKLYADGGTQFAGLAKSSSRKAHPGEHTDPVSFAVCVRPDGEEQVYSAVLKNAEAESEESARSLPHASVGSFQTDFPFTKLSYDGVPCGATVSLRAFNPTLIHNSIDSGIPAAFFEVTLNNPTARALTISFGVLLRSSFVAGVGTPSYDKSSGAFFAELAETAPGVPAKRRGSIGVASDSADFTYAIFPERAHVDSFAAFCAGGGFLSDTAVAGPQVGLSALLSFPVRLEPGESQTRRFLVAWSFPYCAESPAKSGEKNYYCHYFSDLGSCVSYCFTHFTRLFEESKKIFELTHADFSTLPTSLRSVLALSLAAVKDPALRRDSAGILKGLSEDSEEGRMPLSFALDFLFPGISAATGVWVLNRQMTARGRSTPSAFDENPTVAQAYARLRMVLRLFYAYRSTSEVRFYTENWVDISTMLELLVAYCERLLFARPSVESEEDTLFDVLLPALHAMIGIAELLRDKKRKLQYVETLDRFRALFEEKAGERCEKMPLRVLSSSFIARYLGGYAMYDENSRRAAAARVASLDLSGCVPDYYACAELVVLKETALCEKAVAAFEGYVYPCKKELYGSVMQLAALFPAFSGFTYDKNEMRLTLSPEESLCDEAGVFKCFFSADGVYGRVELGADYTELIPYSGVLKVRTVLCSHRLYKVLYGGRSWPCDIDEDAPKTVTMDNNLSVGKTKKLTLLMDLTK